MIDPDAQTFRASQSAHAQEVRTVGILTKTLGCTRTQAREAIHRVQAQRTVPQNANFGSHATSLFQSPPVIRRGPEVINEGPRQAAVGAIADAPIIPPIVDPSAILPTPTNFTLIIDGSLYTADTYLTNIVLVP